MKSWANKKMPPFNNHLGFMVEEWRKNHIKISAELKPEHLNHSGIPHGGFISALLDAAIAMPGLYSEDPLYSKKALTLSFVAPFMILISTIGMILRDDTRKIFYLPIGLMGISIILEKDIRRRFDRKNILKKIKSYQKVK